MKALQATRQLIPENPHGVTCPQQFGCSRCFAAGYDWLSLILGPLTPPTNK
jgi:hypothetical protein